jgi:hypothetical protein
MLWALVFVVWGGNGAGGASVGMETRDSCLSAMRLIMEGGRPIYRSPICINTKTGEIVGLQKRR